MEERSGISRDAPSVRDYHIPPAPLTPSPSPSSCGSSFDAKDATERVDAAQAQESPLDTAFEQLKLTEKVPTYMFRMIGAVFQHVTSQDVSIDLGVEDWRAHFEYAENLSQEGHRDIEALRLIRTILDLLWSHSLEEDLLKVATLLADGSRECESKTENR